MSRRPVPLVEIRSLRIRRQAAAAADRARLARARAVIAVDRLHETIAKLAAVSERPPEVDPTSGR